MGQGLITVIDELDYSYLGRAYGGRLYILSREDQDGDRTRTVMVVGRIPCRVVAEHVPHGKGSRELPIGTVYPVWTGIGAVGAVVVGIVFLNELATFWRIFFISTLILSIIGLKVLS